MNSYDDEICDDEFDDTVSVASGDFRLAWMFVSGWRQRLNTGYDLVEMHKRAWDMEDADVETNKNLSKRGSWFPF